MIHDLLLASVILSAPAIAPANASALVYFSDSQIFIPTHPVDGTMSFKYQSLPFMKRQVVSPIGPSVRVLGQESSSPASSRAIWELGSGGTWKVVRVLPPTAKAAFVAPEAWGYLEHSGLRWKILVFEGESQSPSTIDLKEDIDVWDVGPPVWIANERAVLLSTRESGRWAENQEGVSVNTRQAGPWIVSRFTRSSVSERVTDGLAPTLSPDGRTLAFFRGRDVWLRTLASGAERVVARSSSIGREIRPFFFWRTGSRAMILNFSVPNTLGYGNRCAELDLSTGRIRDIWIGGNACVAELDVEQRNQIGAD